MKRTAEKDPYSLLGVGRDATPEELREAYVARARVIHPDRFDAQRQPRDWKKANEMLSELNEAYAILRSPERRAAYDRFHWHRSEANTMRPFGTRASSVSSAGPFDDGELTPGAARYADLPAHVQEKLRKRQENGGADQFRVRLSSLAANVVFLAVLICWFVYLFLDAGGARWQAGTIAVYAVCTAAVGVLIGRTAVAIARWTTATLKPFFYVTPLYFIKTEYDRVSFRPIWMLRDAAVTRNPGNGSYGSARVVLRFDGHDEEIRLPSRQAAKALLDHIKAYDAAMHTMVERRDYEYFRKHDDFFQVPRSGDPSGAVPHTGGYLDIYGLSVAFCIGGLLAAVAVNNDLWQKRWVRHASPPVYVTASPVTAKGPTNGPVPGATKDGSPVSASPAVRSEAGPAVREQPLPRTGSVRKYVAGESIAPLRIKAPRGTHYLVKLVDVHSRSPVVTVFVRSGSTADVKVPLGSYEVRYASGEHWYGYEYLFGADTVYSSAETMVTFAAIGDRLTGYAITLYKAERGNLDTRAIKPEEF